MATNSEYILFLDETDVNDYNNYLCLAGLIISRTEYEDILIPQINQIKTDILGKPHIVFHYKEMRKNQGEFDILFDNELRKTFWNALCDVLKNTEFKTVAAYMDAQSYRLRRRNGFVNEYSVLFNEIINSYIYFLHQHNQIGSIVIESRQIKQNKALQQTYYNIISNGTSLYHAHYTSKKLATMSFNIKMDNCIGLQIADFIPLTFIRHLHGNTNRYNLYQIFSNKLYDGGIKNIDGYGLIKVLK